MEPDVNRKLTVKARKAELHDSPFSGGVTVGL